MPYTQKELDRIIELFNLIEGNKSDEYKAPTYKDSPYLKEIAKITLDGISDDADTLEESIPALEYLTDCYNSMCRAGMSVKFYRPLLECHSKLSKLRGYDNEDMQCYQSDFYNAVKARNYYEQDDCKDLLSIVSDTLPSSIVTELLNSAQRDRKSSIKQDPVEKTEEYLAVIDEVEEKIDKNKQIDICFEYWNLKAEYLFEHGILWRSPAQLNPGVMFD